MSTAERVIGLVVLVGLATTLTLPDRKTDKVLTAGFNGFSGLLGTAMGFNRR